MNVPDPRHTSRRGELRFLFWTVVLGGIALLLALHAKGYLP